MKPIKIITDSGADLPKELRKAYSISYFQFSMIVGGVEYPADLDWGDVTPQTLYDTLRNGDHIYMLPSTELEIETLLSTYLENDFDILYIACSAKLCDNLNKVNRVASRLLPHYPGCTVLCIDSRNVSIGTGMLAVKAAELRKAGLSLEEISTQIRALRNQVNQFFTVPTMFYLSHANMVHHSSALLGRFFNVHPIITTDAKGILCTQAKKLGWENALEYLAAQVEERAENPETQTLFIVHADAPQTAKHLQALLQERDIAFQKTVLSSLGPVSGTATGPGTVGVFFFGKKVTYTAKWNSTDN